MGLDMTTSTFPADHQALHADLTAARAELVSVVESLSDADLDRRSRDEWPPRSILEHLVQREHFYAMLVHQLRGLPVAQPAAIARSDDSVPKIISRLDLSRSALLQALDGVTETDFYHLHSIGEREFDVVGVARHSAEHDIDHTAQITRILADSR